MSIRLATYNGTFRDPSVAVITTFSLGNPGVHSEVWIHDYRVTARDHRFGEDKHKSMDIIPLDPDLDTSQWHVMKIPITDKKKAVDIIEEELASPAVYHYSIPELAMPKFILDSIDTDLDCCHPEKWDTLFCSQFVLLFLRRCAIAGILDVPKEKQRLLWSVNSKGCLPSRLQIIANHIFS
jgi:hypothetical protein